MATTSIHAITQTVGASLGYIMRDKTETFLKNDVADSIAYVMNDKTGEVTYFTYTSTINCAHPENPEEDFYALMYHYGEDEVVRGSNKTKNGQAVIAWHLIQSFDGQVDPKLANEVGYKLAEELFGNYPVVISTHTNTENTHNHIEFCAWNFDGKKYNYDHAAYDKIRETSDRLCDEYGLLVLEETRERNLIRWKDSEGNTRYYEPTERKDRLREQRAAGIAYEDDVNSYRNTIQYEVSEAKKDSNRNIVKESIDSLLPYANSFDHLLFMLREQGYRIKDKKKNGDWLKYITYTSPFAERGVRDYMIDKENNFYSRENLTRVIEENVLERTRNGVEYDNKFIQYYDEYVYGEFDVQSLDENYRAKSDGADGFTVVKRGEPERDVIRDMKQTDNELKEYIGNESVVTFIAKVEAEAKNKNWRERREAQLIKQMHECVDTLHFMERKEVFTYEQINEVVRGLWSQYAACQMKISEAEELIQRLEVMSNAPIVVQQLTDKIEQNRDKAEYIFESYANDARVLRSARDAVQKYSLDTEEGREKMREKIDGYRQQIHKLESSIETFKNELSEYNECVRVLRRIDKSLDNNRNNFFEGYDRIKASGEQAAERNNETAQKRQKDRDR